MVRLWLLDNVSIKQLFSFDFIEISLFLLVREWMGVVAYKMALRHMSEAEAVIIKS